MLPMKGIKMFRPFTIILKIYRKHDHVPSNPMAGVSWHVGNSMPKWSWHHKFQNHISDTNVVSNEFHEQSIRQNNSLITVNVVIFVVH